jgi:hypothetical protein
MKVGAYDFDDMLLAHAVNLQMRGRSGLSGGFIWNWKSALPSPLGRATALIGANLRQVAWRRSQPWPGLTLCRILEPWNPGAQPGDSKAPKLKEGIGTKCLYALRPFGSA